MLKVYTPFMDFLGFEDKKIVHEKGLWHKVFGGIVYNPKLNSIYLQTIYPKESYTFERPDYVDFGVGGHIEDDETVLQAGIRETREELGQEISLDNLCFLGIRICNCDLSATYKIREFQYFYGIKIDKSLQEFSFEQCDNEVKSFIEVDIDDFLRLLSKEVLEIKANEVVLDKDTRQGRYFSNVSLTAERVIPDYFSDKSIFDKFLALKSVIKKET